MDKEKIQQIRKGKIPEHLAIIMDGNRRWAKENNLKPWEGHKKGKETLKLLSQFQKSDSAVPIRIITLYSLSEDNEKKRTKEERAFLMSLFEEGFKELVKDRYVYDNDVKISVFGNYDALPKKVAKTIGEAVKKTKNHDKFFLNFCINYDGQSEIVEACRKIVKDAVDKNITEIDITKELIKKNLFTASFNAPELIIRSGGEQRLSGFLVWDASYSELYFTNKYWPEINEDDILEGIKEYQNRERRFGS